MALSFSYFKTLQILNPKFTITNSFSNYSKPNLQFNLTSKTPNSIFSFVNFKPQNQPLHRNTITKLFTGIVEELGEVKNIGYNRNDLKDGFELTISAKTVLEDVKLGDSIAVNGTCLTVTQYDLKEGLFSVGLAPETLRLTSLVELSEGSVVNLERAMLPSTRMGGHFVQGHVDGTGEIVGFEEEGDSLWVKVKVAKELLRLIVPKGYITVDGTSLTVVKVFDDEGCFNFMLVNYTQKNVVIPLKKVGMKVNLEVDIVGKYVERILKSGFGNDSASE